MFIRNPSSIKQNNIIKVSEQQKELLISFNYSPLSYDNSLGKWIFVVDQNLLSILKLQKGGKAIEKSR